MEKSETLFSSAVLNAIVYDNAVILPHKMAECGITAILNFAPCKLNVPDGVILENENLALSLAYLNNQIK